MALTDDVKAPEAGMTTQGVALEAVRQQTAALRTDLTEFKAETQPELRTIRELVNELRWLPFLLRYALGLVTGLLFIIIPALGYAIYGAGEIKSQVKELDRRTGELEKRVNDIDIRLARIEVTVAEMKATMAEMKTSNDQNFKAIFATLARIEANQKKEP